MDNHITLSHGNGGRQANDLIKKMFASRFGLSEPLADSGVFEIPAGTLAFSTDSYVIDPVFFPGGNIGKLAICGTVNDLTVSAAEPKFISVAFIIEEGFPIADLETIVMSMAEEAGNAGVKIVTGDTKVVGKGGCDRIFINTSGIGIIRPGFEQVSTGKNIRNGDRLIVNGTLGNHALAIMGARKDLSFATTMSSDCASLNHLAGKILDRCKGVRFMRDLTRGGLAAVLNELKDMIHSGIVLDEKSIPVDEQVRGICEMLGFDPLQLANEGKFVIVADPGDEREILEILRTDPLGTGAKTIGEIDSGKKMVILNTVAGGERIVEMPSGTMLPRIC